MVVENRGRLKIDNSLRMGLIYSRRLNGFEEKKIITKVKKSLNNAACLLV